MRKIIAAFNLSIDGYSDHTAGVPDEEIHAHYAQLLGSGDAILYGKTTYQLMQYWQTLLKNPSGEKAMDDFAVAIDKVPKIVFSTTLKETGWDTATLATQPLEEVVSHYKQQPGKDIFIGSRSLIVQLTNAGLIDEYQLCVHPVAVGTGLPLFKDLHEKTLFTLEKTKIFKVGAIILYYKRA